MVYTFTPPQDFKEAQNLTVDYFRYKLNNKDFKNFGKEGQKQYGIDSYGLDKGRELYCMVQVKTYNTEKQRSQVISDFRTDLGKFDISFKAKFSSLYAQCGCYYVIAFCEEVQDVKLEVEEISISRRGAGLCDVQILFWNDILADIKSNPEIMQKYQQRNFVFQNSVELIPNLQFHKTSLEIWEIKKEKNIETVQNQIVLWQEPYEILREAKARVQANKRRAQEQIKFENLSKSEKEACYKILASLGTAISTISNSILNPLSFYSYEQQKLSSLLSSRVDSMPKIGSLPFNSYQAVNKEDETYTGLIEKVLKSRIIPCKFILENKGGAPALNTRCVITLPDGIIPIEYQEVYKQSSDLEFRGISNELRRTRTSSNPHSIEFNYKRADHQNVSHTQELCLFLKEYKKGKNVIPIKIKVISDEMTSWIEQLFEFEVNVETITGYACELDLDYGKYLSLRNTYLGLPYDS